MTSKNALMVRDSMSRLAPPSFMLQGRLNRRPLRVPTSLSSNLLHDGFRFFVKTRLSANDYNIVLLSGSTASDLETRTANLQKDVPLFLGSAAKTSYVVIAKEIEVNPYIRVKINGVETDVPMGSSIRQAIEQTTARGVASNALAHLSVLTLYRVQKLPHARLSPVEWDDAAQEILNLTLRGWRADRLF